MDCKPAATLSNFAARFCNEVDKDRSSVCSPMSAQAVLALTALGCAGASRAELLAAMDLSDDEAIRSTFDFVTSSLKLVKGVTLRMANRVYVTKNGTLKPEIQKDAKEIFDSGLEQVDFMEAGAANKINKWAAERTENMIKNIVSPGDLGEDTGVLLVNAIYFQGFWQTQFSKKSTKERTFYMNNTTEIKVAMMSLEDKHFPYKNSPELKAKIMQMAYQGGQTSMVIVLPDEVEGLGDVMRQLAAGHDLMGEIAWLRDTPVDVMIPKFKVETDIDLKELLPKIGIKSIFDKRTSDIQMLTSNKRQYVSKAVQKAVIQVDEMGTEAAAMSYYNITLVSKKRRAPKKQKFIADRPFLFMLTAGHIPLFLGVYQGSGCSQPDVSYEEIAMDLTKKKAFLND